MKTKKFIAMLLVAVMVFAFAGCKDKPTSHNEPGTLFASLDEIYEDSQLKDYYLKNPDSFMRAAQDEIKLTEAQAQSFLSDSDNWSFYNLNVKVSNNTQVNYTFIGFESSETPEGMWFSTLPVNGELSMPPAATEQLYPATVLINTAQMTPSQMYSAVAGLEVELVYYETPEDDEEEIPESKHKKLKITNNIIAPEQDDVAPEEQISAKRKNIEDASAFLEAYRANSIAFSNESKLYGMDSDTAAKAIAADSGWECYTLNIEIENKTDDDLSVIAVIAAENGKNGVWVCGVSQYGEYGMPANDKQVLPVSVLVDTGALGGKPAQEVISQVAIQLEYVVGETIDELGNESLLPSKTVDVK